MSRNQCHGFATLNATPTGKYAIGTAVHIEFVAFTARGTLASKPRTRPKLGMPRSSAVALRSRLVAQPRGRWTSTALTIEHAGSLAKQRVLARSSKMSVAELARRLTGARCTCGASLWLKLLATTWAAGAKPYDTPVTFERARDVQARDNPERTLTA